MSKKTILQTALSGGDENEISYLSSPTKIVKDLSTKKLEGLVQDLLDTMAAYPICVGLAAPQIGRDERVAVAKISERGVIVLINPQIISISGKKDKKRESCMSVWGLAGTVERRENLRVSYFNAEGEIVQDELFHGFDARVVAHEIDHLDGLVYTSHVVDELMPTDLFDGQAPTA